MSEGSLLKNGNGTLRWERSIVIIATALGLVGSIVAIMWQLFAIAAAVHDQEKTNDRFAQRLTTMESGLRVLDGQVQRNDDFQHRLTLAEGDARIRELAVNGLEVRVAALRADLEAQRTAALTFQTETRSANSSFQTEQRAAIGHITEIVTDVRLALGRGFSPGRK